jgi:hypothetical protein
VDRKAISDMLEAVKERCESWVTEHGPLPSEDVKKVYKPVSYPGRRTLDEESLEKELGPERLSRFYKQGKGYQRFEWKKA